MAGGWRDWARLRLTKNGAGQNNSICGNLPLGHLGVHPPNIWVVADYQDDYHLSDQKDEKRGDQDDDQDDQNNDEDDHNE